MASEALTLECASIIVAEAVGKDLCIARSLKINLQTSALKKM